MPSWSPYSYGFDNPVKYSDPDGLAPEICIPCLMIAGGVKDALMEIGTQMTVNAIKGENIMKIDWADVRNGGVKGFLTAGMSGNYKKAKIAIELATELANASEDNFVGTENDKSVFDGTKTEIEALKETGTSILAGKAGEATETFLKTVTNTKLTKKLSTTKRQAKRAATGSKNEKLFSTKAKMLEGTIKGNEAVSTVAGKGTTELVKDKVNSSNQ